MVAYSSSLSMAALAARFVGNHRLCSEDDRFLHRRVLPNTWSAPPGVISCCIDPGAGKPSIKAEKSSKSMSKETIASVLAEGVERRALSLKTMEHWIQESAAEIVQNLRGLSSLLVEVYTEKNGGKIRLKIDKTEAEDWPEIQEKWRKGERSLPDGIIVVEELKNETQESKKMEKEERFWGLMVQGKGFDCAPCCYILKTNTRSTNLHISCTYFVLIKVRNFNESAKSQVDTCFLLD